MFSSRQVLTLALLFCLLLFGRFAVALIFKTRVYAAFACWTLGHVGPKISLGASGLMYRGLNDLFPMVSKVLLTKVLLTCRRDSPRTFRLDV